MLVWDLLSRRRWLRASAGLMGLTLPHALTAAAAPAPWPRREKPLPSGSVVVDFSPLVDPPPTHGRWALDFNLGDDRSNSGCLGNWTGVAGKGAAEVMAGKFERALRGAYGDWLSVRRDPSGEKLILLSRPGLLRVAKVRLSGLPESQTPTVRTARRGERLGDR